MATSARAGLGPKDDTFRSLQDSIAPIRLSRTDCEEERRQIRERFLGGTSAELTTTALCELSDRCVRQVLEDALQSHRADTNEFALLALGGFGRGHLFPYSDLDLLFLFESKRAEQKLQAVLAQSSRTLWDLGFKVSSATRTMEECARFSSENVEFHLAILDRRFLAGDRAVFQRLDEKILPRLEKQTGTILIDELSKLTAQRSAKFGNTIFHLEPNVKEAPGGLRDFNASAWLSYLSKGNRELQGPDAAQRQLALNAAEFISHVRCFLHYSNGRDDNRLTYELQSAAANESLGVGDGVARSAAEWMRLYYRHARTLHRQLQRSLSIRANMAQPLWQKWLIAGRPEKSQTCRNKPFAIRNGSLEILDPTAYWNREAILSLLTEAAETGFPLAPQAERELAYILSHSELPVAHQEFGWTAIKQIFKADHPSAALRPMHRVGLLTDLLPEFGIIDSLVIRDFYHRYTVDEHSLRAIEHLQELSDPHDARDMPFAGLWKTVERRELLVLALLLHDVGKGLPGESHVAGSLTALETAARRLGLSPEEIAEVHFLIQRHLDMSATMQLRDIFDPATVLSFSGAVGTRERLQRLCLLTYADIHAVNPDALTPWKSEMLWQLYMAASNHLARSVDSNRLQASTEESLMERLRGLAGCEGTKEIERFLEGFPRRYLGVHSPQEIASHFALQQDLGAEPAQIKLILTPHIFTLTLLTADRPGLFATVAGVLSKWGMNIVKAEAFANSAGIILDTFHFTDSCRTFELNPGEAGRFGKNLRDILSGEALLEPPMADHKSSLPAALPKVPVATTIRFDDESSGDCSLLEIVTQDRHGLLYRIGSAITRLRCNIEVALIDTEGQKVIDVFYLTSGGAKLKPALKELLLEALQEALA